MSFTLDEGVSVFNAAASFSSIFSSAVPLWHPLQAHPARWARAPTLLCNVSIRLFIDLPLIKDDLILKSECLLAVSI